MNARFLFLIIFILFFCKSYAQVDSIINQIFPETHPVDSTVYTIIAELQNDPRLTEIRPTGLDSFSWYKGKTTSQSVIFQNADSIFITVGKVNITTIPGGIANWCYLSREYFYHSKDSMQLAYKTLLIQLHHILYQYFHPIDEEVGTSIGQLFSHKVNKKRIELEIGKKDFEDGKYSLNITFRKKWKHSIRLK